MSMKKKNIFGTLASVFFVLAVTLLPVETLTAQEAATESVSVESADETPILNSGDTAWMIVATVLVLFMTIPGLSL